jgi:uncharacterized protein YwqG
MSNSLAALIAAAILVPIVFLLIYAAFRNFFASARNLKDAVEGELARRKRGADQPIRKSPVRQSNGPEAAGVQPKRQGVDLVSEVMASFQSQAKKSDDAHKARIRAHVERKVPPISDDGRETIERARRARLAIKHVFPPRLPQRSMSYFGGLPIVPEEFDWPTIHNRDGRLERLTFMAQIACADLPAGPAREMFPDKGYLYFFAPMVDTFGPDAAHFVVRYEPRRATQKWEPLDMPFTGKIEPDDSMDLIWRGKRTHYDRVEIEFGWIEEPSDDEVAARGDEGHAFQVAEKIRAERLEAFFGPPPAPSSLLSVYQKPKDTLWTPYAGFPINWKTARIVRKFVEAYHREETEDVANRLKALGEVAEDHPEARRLRTLQRELSMYQSKMSTAFFPTISARAKDYESPPVEVKTQILAFLEDLRINGMPSSKERTYLHLRLPLVLNQWLATAAIHGAEGALTDPDGAALVPPDVVAAMAHRHTARKHQMLGEGEVVQVAAGEMKDRYVLLLQLGPDAALDWTRGEMGPLQYWITPEDLAAKQFENTVLTIEAY